MFEWIFLPENELYILHQSLRFRVTKLPCSIVIYIFSIDDCSPDPCQNNATCVDGVNDYTCNCTAGYYGKNCSQSKLDHFPSPSPITREHSYHFVHFTSFNCILLNAQKSLTMFEWIFLHSYYFVHFTSFNCL